MTKTPTITDLKHLILDQRGAIQLLRAPQHSGEAWDEDKREPLWQWTLHQLTVCTGFTALKRKHRICRHRVGYLCALPESSGHVTLPSLG
jgi:hypothetical protein